MTAPADLYRYRATLIPWSSSNPSAWHDGDTCAVDVDLGCHVHWHGRLRCAGFNAPELSTGAPGAAATEFVRGLADVGVVVYLNSISFGSRFEEDDFGRMLAYVTLDDGRDLAAEVLAAGMAVPF